jgi:hypothetical protein
MNSVRTAAQQESWTQHTELLRALDMYYEQGGKEQDEAWRNVTDEDAEMWKQIEADKEARHSAGTSPELPSDEYPEEMDEDDLLAAAVAPYEADAPEHIPSPTSLDVNAFINRYVEQLHSRMVLVC